MTSSRGARVHLEVARRLLLATLVASGLVWLPSVGIACSPIVHDIDSLTDGSTGVFEQQTIVYAPADPLSNGRSASVVVRYWGEPPAQLGAVIHRGREFPLNEILGGTCGLWRDPVGSLRYGRVDAGADATYRSAGHPLVDGAGAPLMPGEYLARLEAQFGPPVEVEVKTSDVAQGVVGVWLPKLGTASLLMLLVAVSYVFMRRRRLMAEQTDTSGYG